MDSHPPSDVDQPQKRVEPVQLRTSDEQLGRGGGAALKLSSEWNASDAPSRLRNMLAIIRSVFRRTMDTADSLEDVSLHFTGRLDLLARFSATMLNGRPSELEDMVRDVLLSVGESDGPSIEIAGPTVWLNFRQAPLIGLALHELATNSIKFGALVTEGASLAISWRIEGQAGDQLRLDWLEKRVPIMSSAPMREGFGREFIEQGLPYQLKAETSFRLLPGELHCEIKLPIDPISTNSPPD